MTPVRTMLLLCLLIAPVALGNRGLEPLSVHVGHTASARPLVGTSATCTMCGFILDRVKAGLNDTTTQATLLDKLLKVCGDLPSELVTECSDLVRTYEPVLCQFIEAADSQQLCTMLGACSDGDVKALGREGGARSALTQGGEESGPTPNDSCDVCKMTVIEAHSLVTNPNVQANLLNYTKALCATLGDAYTKACQDYIDVYAPALFNVLEKFLSSDELCVDLGICPAHSLLSVFTKQWGAWKVGMFAWLWQPRITVS